MIFVAAPYIERLRTMPRLSGALAAITAAVVGVILNLTVWFAVHVLFATVRDVALSPVHTVVPEPLSINVVSLALLMVATVMLFRLHLGIVWTLLVCGCLGMLVRIIG